MYGNTTTKTVTVSSITPAANTLKSKVVITGDGLYSDSTETGRYVFKGTSPSNSITLGFDTYRIIAVESDGTLKVIKNVSIGRKVFDPGYSTSISGVTKYDETNLSNTITQEKAYKWKCKVGLMTASDYVKSNSNTSLCGTVYANGYGAGNYSTCKTTSWLSTIIIGSQFITPSGYGLYWYSSDYGLIGTVLGNHPARYPMVPGPKFPVLYLSSDITSTGEGTSSSPYTVN